MEFRIITPAELKTLRESLGLTAQWVADQAGVQQRTVQYWESGKKNRMTIPNDVADMLTGIDRRLEHLVQATTSRIQASLALHGKPNPEDIILIRYRCDADLWHFQPEFKPLPATTHAALLDRLRRALLSLGITVLICYMERDDYMNWLRERKDGGDSEAARKEWALEQNVKGI